MLIDRSHLTRPWSCDTYGITAGHAWVETPILGKNSDRPARECQPLRRIPARSGGGTLRLAHIEIDDVEKTYAHLGSSPYWCWGHEEGINEAGVAIGNEAQFTRDFARTAAEDRAGNGPALGLVGMEILRLGLERGGTAREAIEVMTTLIEKHGQYASGGVGKPAHEGGYDNSFVVVDPSEVWVLETSGRHWVARVVTEPSVSISNEPTIRTEWTLASAGLEDHLREVGAPATGDDYAESVVDPEVPLQLSHLRLMRSRELLDMAASRGTISWQQARRVLTDHYEGTFLDGPAFNAARPDFLSICMHLSPARFTWGNTASSILAVPNPERPYWWWAPVTPCTSVYLPVAVEGGELPATLGRAGTAHGSGPSAVTAPVDEPADGSYWWTFQLLLEATAGDELGTRYNERQPIVRARLDPLQQSWIDQVETLITERADSAAWDALTARATDEALHAAHELLQEFR